ncbi:c-type cytochrome [Sulfurovum sp.]|uniref:c-type cytochrome n=1 Tax=Sulfurovum sp. TaxID=1969726 RepID=UPI002867D7E3|nr:c-type cytochrome [Sulfurovum sp.]
MKRNTLLSLVLAALLFTACGEETKKATAEATEATTEAVKQDAANTAAAVKEKAAEVAEATKTKAAEVATDTAELKEEAGIKATEATEAVKEKAAELTEATKDAVEAVMPEESATPASPAAYAKCQACHGVDGKTKAMGKSAIIAGQDKAAIITSMNEYKAGTRDVAGMGMLMKGQVASMSDADIEAVAEYLSAIK